MFLVRALLQRLFNLTSLQAKKLQETSRFSKRGKESSTFIDNSHFVTRLAIDVAFGASGSRLFWLAMQGFGGLPQSVNLF